jgi:hypothetical protein
MNLNSVWATEKAAPVFRSGVVVIRQFVLLHHGAEVLCQYSEPTPFTKTGPHGILRQALKL